MSLKKILYSNKKFDWILFFSIFIISALSLVELYSIALGQENVSLLNFKKQVFFISVGLFCLFLFSALDYHFWFNNVKYLYIFSVILLLSVLIFGSTIRGTKGWFSFFGLGIQPVEFIKIILISSLSSFFSLVPANFRSLKQLAYSGLILFIPASLVIMQPDFGSAMILGFVWFFSLFLAGFKRIYFIGILIIIAALSIFSWSFLLKDYQKNRILTFVKPDSNSLDQSYNVTQALIAVGSGGLKGRGIGFGSQSQLKFLPEAQNDFIFAVISEEIGFLGVLLLFSLYFVFFWRLISPIHKIKDDFGRYFVSLTAGLIFIEMFINIGMNTGLLPIVGISLPFLSYGGSSIIATFIMVGICENIIKKTKEI
jgi:rod shape determining protein RodA